MAGQAQALEQAGQGGLASDLVPVVVRQDVRLGADFAQIVTQGSFSTAAEFREIIVRSNPDGSTVRLGDVARVEIGRDSYGFGFSVNGQESVGLSIQLTSGANALAVARGLRQRMAEIKPPKPDHSEFEHNDWSSEKI